MKVPQFLGEGDRYKLDEREVARGGMGAVYRALDTKMAPQMVAIKVMLDTSNPETQALFDKEWRILAELQHANIVAITDRGEFRDGADKFPYFVMPFLNGKNLQQYLQANAQQITAEKIVSIITQAADGIHAAHSRGVVHRDIKPSNIFVLDSGSVVVIDFGVVHLADKGTSTTLKGTTPYMAPELLGSKKNQKPAPASDLFSLAVVCYEALTGKQPFARKTFQETIDAILREIPTPAHEINHKLSLLLSQVVQKAMAKDRGNRYSNVKEFADKLNRALRNEPLPEFDRSTIENRLRVVRDALAKGELTHAHSLLRSIEEDGLMDVAITSERERIDQALQQKQIQEHIQGARYNRESQQYFAAIERLNEALALDPDNHEARLEMESINEERRQNTLNLARQFMQEHRFDGARQAIADAYAIRPRDTEATELLGELERMEDEDRFLAERKENLYREAQTAKREGHLKKAVEKLDQIAELNRQLGANARSERDAIFRNLHEHLSSELGRFEQASQEVRGHLAEQRFEQAVAVSEGFLATNPGNAVLEALRLEAQERVRESRLDLVAKVRAQVESLSDLAERVTVLEQAVSQNPNTPQLAEMLKAARNKKELNDNLMAQARKAEQARSYGESIELLEMAKKYAPSNPVLQGDLDRLMRLREDEARANQRGQVLQEASIFLRSGEYQKALEQCQLALELFPGDAKAIALQNEAREKALHAPEVLRLFTSGKTHLYEGRTDAALDAFRQAAAMDPVNRQVRHFLGVALLEKINGAVAAGSEFDAYLSEAQKYIPDHPEIRSLAGQSPELKRERSVTAALSAARSLTADGNHNAALVKIEEALKVYPEEPRLLAELGKIQTTLKEVAESAASEPTQPVPEPNAKGGSFLDSVYGPDLDRSIVQPPEPAPKATEEPPVPVEVPDIAPAPVKPRKGKKYALKVAAAVVVLAIGVGLYAWIRGRNVVIVVEPPQIFKLEISATPDNAEIFVDDKNIGLANAFSDLAPGNHEVRVTAPGYEPSIQSVSLTESKSIPVALKPIPMALRIVTNQPSIKVSLNGQLREGITSSQPLIEGITPGEYTLKIEQANGKFVETKFVFKPGAPIVPASLPVDNMTTVLFVGSVSGKARAECSNCVGSKVRVDEVDQPIEKGREFSITDGERHAQLTSVDGNQTLSIASGPAPAATVAVYWKPVTVLQPQPPSPEELLSQAVTLMTKNLCDKAEGTLKQVEVRLKEPVFQDPARSSYVLEKKGAVDAIRSRIETKRTSLQCIN